MPERADVEAFYRGLAGQSWPWHRPPRAWSTCWCGPTRGPATSLYASGELRHRPGCFPAGRKLFSSSSLGRSSRPFSPGGARRLLPFQPGMHLRGITCKTAGPISMRTLSASPAATSPAAATSTWSYLSWALFVLAALAAVGIGVWWVALRPAANDPYVGPAAGVFTLLG